MDIQAFIVTTVEQWRLSTFSNALVSKSDFYKKIDEIPTTDLDAAIQLLDLFNSQLTYIPTKATAGDWYVWNGVVHDRDESGLVDDFLAKAFADALKTSSDFMADQLHSSGIPEDGRKEIRNAMGELRSYAKTIRSASGLKNLKTRIRFEFQKPRDFFDQDQRWAVMSDGRVIDLENIDAEPLAPSALRPVARHLGVTYTGNWSGMEALPVKWTQALSQWTPDEAVQDYLRIAAGAALLGRGDAKNIVTLVGLSHTGKSTYLNVLKKVFGTYAGALPATAILQKYGGATNFEQHRARGKRFLYLSEPQNQRTDDAFLKNLSGGGDTITTSEKGKDAVEWEAQCVLHIAANHVPKIDTQDNAITGRVNIVGFDHVFDPSEYTGNIVDDLLSEEGSAIMFWILDGAREYLKLGHIPVPDSVKARSASNVVESSAPLMWLHEMVETDELIIHTSGYMKDMIEPKDGYDMFTRWCLETGEKIPTKKRWLAEIEAFNKMPADRKGKRSEGKARVWGVMKSAKHDSRKVHLEMSGNSFDWGALQTAAFTAPHEQ